MSEPEEKVNQPENNIDENPDNEKDWVFQDKPYKITSFLSGCFGFIFINVLILFVINISLPHGRSIIDTLLVYIQVIIILIVNFFSVRYSFITGKRSFAYGIITATLFFMFFSGPCILDKG